MSQLTCWGCGVTFEGGDEGRVVVLHTEVISSWCVDCMELVAELDRKAGNQHTLTSMTKPGIMTEGGSWVWSD